MEMEGPLVRSFYFGSIGSRTTEILLERFGQEGSFLLRDSETVQGAYCLCVRKTPFVHTYRLVHTADGWFLQQDSGVRLPAFRTVEALIEHYRRGTACGVSVAPLINPLHRTQTQHISQEQELPYMETCCSSSDLNLTSEDQDR